MRIRVRPSLLLLTTPVLLAGCGSGSPAPAPSTPAAPSALTTASTPQSTPAPSVPATSGAPTPAGSSTAAGFREPAGGAVPAGFVPYSATWISSSKGWVLGTAPCSNPVCTSVLRTEDGGRTWVGIHAPQAPLPHDRRGALTPSTVREIRFADDRNGWAVGGALYATHDGGATWHPVSVRPSGSAVAALATSAGSVFAAMGPCPTQPSACPRQVSVYASSIGSDDWKPVSSASAPIPLGDRELDAITVKDGRWFVPGTDGVHLGDVDGRTATVSHPCPAPVLPELAVVDPQHLDA